MSLKFNAKTHRYWLDKKPIPGVTTIIGKGLPKPALPYWAAKSVAEYVVADLDRTISLVEQNATEAAIAALKQTPWTVRDTAAVRGTEVHALAEQLVHGDEVEAPEHLAPFIEGYAHFLDGTKLVPICTETPVASRAHWYAGTCDLIATIDGETWLLDIKTSSGIYGDFALQLAAYATAEFHCPNPADLSIEAAMPRIARIGAIHVTDEGSQLHEFPSIPEAFDAFLAVKTVADLTKKIDEWKM